MRDILHQVPHLGTSSVPPASSQPPTTLAHSSYSTPAHRRTGPPLPDLSLKSVTVLKGERMKDGYRFTLRMSDTRVRYVSPSGESALTARDVADIVSPRLFTSPAQLRS
ncbi:hypothetical protein BKA93DRAFT_142493 [Sparassis latifolia]